MKTVNGFTLIELLIVVAIIAIIATIALYNFQGAQIRAKISRAESDLRTSAVALEAYRTAETDYPTENYPHPLNEGTLGTPNCIKLIPLTTPVAYITSLPQDPFAKPTDPLNKIPPLTYHYAALNDALYPNNPFFDGDNEEHLVGLWVLQSSGPDCNPAPFQFPRYDPTNGIRSIGNIIRMGP